MDFLIVTGLSGAGKSRAVDALEGKCSRSAVWEVNTEETYHEEQ